ncbi:hypothetical protein A1F99_079000 [Pyrenophora tritici-repentis]|nr:hypothetical protein A1F99_079000 [Pyrenophora tritici-repentis]
MHPAALLISLAGFAAAVPLPHDMTDGQAMNMAHDAVQPKVETYAEYGAYYTDYGNYAKTDQGVAKRTKMATYTPHSNYGCYPGASVEDVTNMKKRGYSRYDSHGTYPEARKAPHESLPDNDDKYHIYDPYTEYGHYSAAGGGEGVEKMQ